MHAKVALRSVLAIALLHMALLPIASVQAQDSGLCRATCESDKQQCRAGATKGDASAAATLAGAVALALTLPQARTIPNTPIGNPRDDVDARQRADQESKLAQNERNSQCNTTFMQCLGSCVSAAPAAPTTPGTTQP